MWDLLPIKWMNSDWNVDYVVGFNFVYTTVPYRK